MKCLSDIIQCLHHLTDSWELPKGIFQLVRGSSDCWIVHQAGKKYSLPLSSSSSPKKWSLGCKKGEKRENSLRILRKGKQARKKERKKENYLEETGLETYHSSTFMEQRGSTLQHPPGLTHTLDSSCELYHFELHPLAYGSCQEVTIQIYVG